MKQLEMKLLNKDEIIACIACLYELNLDTTPGDQEYYFCPNTECSRWGLLTHVYKIRKPKKRRKLK